MAAVSWGTIAGGWPAICGVVTGCVPAGGAGGTDGTLGAIGTGSEAAAGSGPSAVPHLAQKRLSSAFALEQFGQTRAI
jgi:hypothetical protein